MCACLEGIPSNRSCISFCNLSLYIIQSYCVHNDKHKGTEAILCSNCIQHLSQQLWIVPWYRQWTGDL